MASERKFIAENTRRVLLKEYLMKEVTRAGFGGLDVQRTPMGTRVTLVTERPGIVIGRRGAAIKNLTRAIEEDFKFDNPQVEVQEVENPNLNAQIMAEKLAFALERGWHFRRAGHSTIRRVMDNGARGCHIIIAGKLTGQRHRTEKFKEGYIKFCGEPKLKDVDKGYAVAKLKPGVIGVTVEIMRPTAKLPDEIDVTAPAEAVEKFPDLAPMMEKKDDFSPVETKPVEEAPAEEAEPEITEAKEGEQ
ncbi:30S ribosomal protein S3 [Methanomassiliicoccus luminyensis]|jgi:small subunit ribosomal protein S3|uniref:30S ribosomal protein S3 n=1 Tax=Methanomassiliicoccus luminyensis TaxID=1080712 RepID=UPI000381ACEF|nr:30S ribosomal protein S3 [Methanomassiliicoccus luminyensis]